MFFLIISINNNNIAYNSIMITIIAWFNLDFEIRIFRLQYTRSCSRPCPLVDRYLSHPKSYLLAVSLFKILCTMRVKRFAPIRHGSMLIHNVVPMPRTIRLTNPTEVDIDITIWLFRNPDIVLVLKRNASPGGDWLLLSLRFRLVDFSSSSLAWNALAQSSNSAFALLNSACARSCSALADKNSCRAWVYSLLALWKAGLTASNCSRAVRILATS